ncbi:MAG: MoaD/ThiS family protein [Phycisphaerae bacterium]
MAVRISVMAFGPAADALGGGEQSLSLEAGATVAQLVARLIRERPALGGVAGLRFAVNRSFATGDRPLADGDVVALIPPVSGG